MAASIAIQAHALSKSYRSTDGQQVHALNGLDLTVWTGEIYALLGPNGAGKTTALSILTTLLLPTSGTAQVAGFDVVTQAPEVRRNIGVTFQEVILDQALTGRRVLDFHGQLYGQPPAERKSAIAELAQMVELTEVLDRDVKSYSGGMKRRLELARGLMTRPQLLFLDEPTQGLDPQNREGIWRYIRRLRDDRGITLLLTTHYMDEAEQLADRVGIIDHGQMILEGAPSVLVSQLGADVVTLKGVGAVQPFLDELQRHSFITQISCSQQTGEDGSPECEIVQIGVDQGDSRLAPLIGMATQHGFQIQSASVTKPSLGQVFMAHTGTALRD